MPNEFYISARVLNHRYEQETVNLFIQSLVNRITYARFLSVNS